MTTSSAAMIVSSQASLPDIQSATLPESYERAKGALAACERIDECKDWADKMAALASYAKQADDQTLHRLATRISARAIRRCGELLKTFENQGARTDQLPEGDHGKLTQRKAAAGAGMSEHQELQAVRVANVPVDDFEAAVESDNPPTVTKLAELGKSSKSAPPGFVQATHAIGVLKEFATFCDEHPAEFVAGGIYPYEVGEIRGHVGVIEAWLGAFLTALRSPDDADDPGGPAGRIQTAWARTEHSHGEWVAASMELMDAMAEARDRFSSNVAFVVWLAEQELDHLSRHDREALLQMAAHRTIATAVLEETAQRSYQRIWFEEVAPRLGHVAKTDDPGAVAADVEEAVAPTA